MITDSSNDVFIWAAYAGVVILTLGLIGYVAWDSSRVKARLAALDQAGVRRRSAGA